jgi:hypothetical protein
MSRMKKLFFAFLLVCAATSAYAGAATFALSGTLTDGAVLGGTMIVDQVAGTVTAANFTIGAPDSLTLSILEYDGGITHGATTFWLLQTGAAPGPYPSLSLVFPMSTLVGYAGGALCSDSALCSGGVSGIVLSPTAQGPNLESGSFALTQESSCSSSIAPSQFTFGDAGGSGTVSLDTFPCQWSITGNPSWVTLSASSGAGSSFSFNVSPNPPPGSLRTATLSISGGGGTLTVTITQAGLVCTYTIADSAGLSKASFSPAGATGEVINVVAPAGCAWTATPNQSFIKISSNASGDGNGSVSYSVASNTSSTPQTGAITIAGLTYVINEQPVGSQPNSCSISSDVPASIRPEGFAEKVGDVVFTCSGQAPSGGVTGDILISFNTGVTNLLLSTGPTDALLLEDEPTAANLALGTNAFGESSVP